MSKRNHKELWEQLKAIVVCGGKVNWSNTRIFDTMTSLEIYQLNQDPMRTIMESFDKLDEKEKGK